jgi:Cellulase (glycosyl hydrolase family 5)
MSDRRRVKRLLVALAPILATLSMTGESVGAPASSVSQSSRAATPPYTVVKNRLLGSNGVRFVPYGFVIDCMALTDDPINELCTGNVNDDPWPGSEMLNAAAGFWHADVIRFQVAQEYLFNSDGSVNTQYLSLIDQLVDQATSLQMASIVTLQEERFHAPLLPTETAVRFWAYMANHFKNNPNVLFDLYNEPRLPVSAVGGSEQKLWRIWRNGGAVGGVQYVGDQALVNTIRHAGAHNVIVAEGNNEDKDLTLLPHYYLRGRNIAYGVEPDLSATENTKAEWKADYGNLTADVPILPEAFLPLYQECNAAAPTVLPRLLDYLQSIHMGLITWTLLHGVTTVGDDLEKPTTFALSRRPTDPCFGRRPHHAVPTTTYGEGRDILNYYAAHSPG